MGYSVIELTRVTPATFRLRLEALGIAIRQFAAMTGVDYESVRKWGTYLRDGDLQDFPPWVELLIAAWERAWEPMTTLNADLTPLLQDRRHGDLLRTLSVDPIPVVLQLRRPFATSIGRLEGFPGGPPDFP